jgi:hypothetical protein
MAASSRSSIWFESCGYSSEKERSREGVMAIDVDGMVVEEVKAAIMELSNKEKMS